MKITHIILLAILIFACMGCARVHMEMPDGTVVDYGRLGKQKLEGVEFQIGTNTVFKLGKSEGSEGNLSKALLNLTEIIVIP